MSEPFAPVETPHPGLAGLSRLRSLIGRSSCPPRPADELLLRWHQASGTSLSFDEWCDPSTRCLASALRVSGGPGDVDSAVVEFAQARSGADHTAEAVAADLVALVRVLRAEGSSGTPSAAVAAVPVAAPHGPTAHHDTVGLLARALAAWAEEQVEVVSAGAYTDPVTGLVTGGFLRARLRELHTQCDALAISPQATFGSVVVLLDSDRASAPELLGARVAVARALEGMFTSGETLAALGTARFVAVMSAYALTHAQARLRSRLATDEGLSLPLQVERERFAADADATWRSLAGTGSGA